MTSDNHKVFNAEKPQLKLSDINDLKKALVNVSVLWSLSCSAHKGIAQ